MRQRRVVTAAIGIKRLGFAVAALTAAAIAALVILPLLISADAVRKAVQAEIRAPLFEDKVVDFIAELATVNDRKVDKETLFADPEDEPASGESAKA